MNTADKHTESYEDRVAREKLEKAAAHRALFIYAAAIATALDWELVPDKPTEYPHTSVPHLRRKSDGASFYLSTGWLNRDTTKITVSPVWPRNTKGQDVPPYFSTYSTPPTFSPTMTFTSTKTPTVAARDIERRFLAHFLPLWEKQAVVAAAQNDSATRRQSIAERVAKLLKGEVHKGRNNDETPTVWLGHRAKGIAEVTFSDNENELKVEVRCTLEQLEALTAQFPPKKGEGQR